MLLETTTDKTVTWTSADERVATVDASGKVTAVAVGQTTITATCGTATATCLVTVEPTLVNEIILSEKSIDIYIGDVYALTATVLPEEATNTELAWSSSDESVATVTADGEVCAVGEGQCDIVATATDGSGVFARCAVTVTADPSGIGELLKEECGEVMIVTLDGTLIYKGEGEYAPTLDKGVYIIRTSDGKTRKLMQR